MSAAPNKSQLQLPQYSQVLVHWAERFLNHYKSIKSASPQTLRAYATDLEQLLTLNLVGYFEVNTPTESIEFVWAKPQSHLEAQPQNLDLIFAQELPQQLSLWGHLARSSRNRKIATTKAFLRFLYDNNLTAKDWGAHLTCTKVPMQIPHHISLDEALALIQGMKNQIQQQVKGSATQLQYQRDLALILLLYGGGLRVSEACQLKWSQIDFNSHVIRVIGKGQKERIIPLPAQAIDALTKLTKLDNLIFADPPLSQQRAYNIVKSWGSKMGLSRPLHPHALRHSYATHLLSSGADLRLLQELLGHSSLAATQKYTHLTTDALASTLQRFHPLSQSKNK